MAEPGAVLGDFYVIMFFTEGFASDGRKASRASAMAYALRLTQNVVVVAGKNHETLAVSTNVKTVWRTDEVLDCAPQGVNQSSNMLGRLA